jgi:hypothetical protein
VLEPQTFDDETSRGIVGIHFACLDLASRVIKTSQLANIRPIDDLWVTLERRCAIIEDGYLYGSYLPAIPNGPNIRDDKPRDLENLDMKTLPPCGQSLRICRATAIPTASRCLGKCGGPKGIGRRVTNQSNSGNLILFISQT